MHSPKYHLPEELLAVIIEHLRLPDAQTIGGARDPDFSKLSEHDQQLKLHLATLARLCRTSKASNRIAKPLLYYVFPGFRLVNARLFARALAREPELGHHVQQVVVDKWEHIAWHDDVGRDGIDRSDLSLDEQCARYAVELGRRTCYPTGLGSPVGSELESGRADVVLTMLMTLCPNVEAIETSAPFIGDELHHQAALRSAELWFLLDMMVWNRWTATSAARYSKVRNLSVRLEKHSGAYGVLFARRLLEMPNVETFTSWRIHCGKLLASHTHLDRFLGSPNLWPGLKQIQLQECRLENSAIGTLLRRSPNLQVMDIHWAKQDERLHYGIIGEFMVTHGKNLETVKLDTRNNTCWHFQGDERVDFFLANFDRHYSEATSSNLGDLRTLTALKHLAVPPRALVGFSHSTRLLEMLPSSLRELNVIGPTREDPLGPLSLDVKNAIERLLKDSCPTTSCLEKITIGASALSWMTFDHQYWFAKVRSIVLREPFDKVPYCSAVLERNR